MYRTPKQSIKAGPAMLAAPLPDPQLSAGPLQAIHHACRAGVFQETLVTSPVMPLFASQECQQKCRMTSCSQKNSGLFRLLVHIRSIKRQPQVLQQAPASWNILP